jgi:hypothetical protein
VSAAWPPTPAAFLTPVTPGHEDEVTAALAALPERPSPFQALESTHLVRWVVVGEPASTGESPPNRPLRGRYLLFTAVSNSPVPSFIEELRERCGAAVDTVWTHCVAYPGSREPQPFHDYLERNRIATPQTFGAYDATVPEIAAALTLIDRHRKLAVRTQLVDDPKALLAAFLDEFSPTEDGSHT